MEIENNYFNLLPNECVCEIMLIMNLKILRIFYSAYSRALKLCDNNYFWNKKYIQDFPNEIIVKANSAKEAYYERVASNLKLPWTIIKSQNAVKNNYFISVPIGARRYISGMNRQWYIDPSWIYHTVYRIAGKPEDVKEALRNGGVSELTVNKILSSTISLLNKNEEPYTSVLSEEFNKHNTQKKEAKIAREIRREFKKSDVYWKQLYAKVFTGETPIEAKSAKEAFFIREGQKRIEALQYTRKRSDLVMENSQFIVIPEGTITNILNIVDNWYMNPTLIVHIGCRIVGEPNNIINSLRNKNIDNETINQIISTAITFQNMCIEPYATTLQEEINKGMKQFI